MAAVELSVDLVLRLGELAGLASIAGGGLMVAMRLGRYTQRIESAINAQGQVISAQGEQLKAVTEEVKKLGEVLTRQAVQDERLDRLRRDVEEIRRGRGLIDWPWPALSAGKH
jgi:hypothetical protein